MSRALLDRLWLSLPLRLLVYGLLAALVMWPIPLDPVGQIAGHPQASAGCHVWVIWWAQNHIHQVHTPLIFFPFGADVMQLYGSDILSPVLLGRLPLPPSLLHNLWCFVLLLGGGLGVDVLARHLGATRLGALLGGAIFLSAPFFQHELLNGTSEILAAAFLPWFAWSLLRTLERPTPWRGAATGTWLGLAVLASAYNLFYAAILVVSMAAHRVARGAPLLRRAWLATAASGLGVAGFFGTPLLWLHHAHGAAALYARREDWLNPQQALPDSFADLLDWFDPRAAQIPLEMHYPLGDTFLYWTTCTVYLGLVALALALWGLVRHSRGPRVAVTRSPMPFLLAALLGGLIALGPYLRVAGEVVAPWGYPIQLPAILFYELFPPFAITALHAYRYASLVVLGLALLASLAPRRGWAALLGLLLVLLDAVVLSPVPRASAVTAAPDSAVLEALAAMPAGAVVYLPFEAEDLGDLSTMLLAQTVHGHPIHDGGIHRRAGEDATVLFQKNGLLSEMSRRGALRLPGPEQTRRGLAMLRAVGFRYVLMPAGQQEFESWLSGPLGVPLVRDDEWLLWQLQPLPTRWQDSGAPEQ